MAWRVSCRAAELGCIPSTRVGNEQPIGKDFFTGSDWWSSALGSGSSSWPKEKDRGVDLGYLQ